MGARARVGFDIVVRFRKRRLWLFRNIPTLTDAMRIAQRLQRERFHDPDAVSILDAVNGIEHSVAASSDGGDGNGSTSREGEPSESSAPPPSGPRLTPSGPDSPGHEGDDRSRRDP